MKEYLTEWRKFLIENKGPKLLDVPDIRQFNEYSCGSACLLAVLAFYDLYDKNEKDGNTFALSIAKNAYAMADAMLKAREQ